MKCYFSSRGGGALTQERTDGEGEEDSRNRRAVDDGGM